MIRYSTDRGLSASIVLLYSNSHEDDIIFEDDLERIDQDMIVREVPDYASRVFFTSGPKKMVDAMLALLNDLGLPEDQIKREYFLGYE